MTLKRAVRKNREIKLERVKLESLTKSWNLRAEVPTFRLKTFQLRSVLSNLDQNFPISDFQTFQVHDFPIKRFSTTCKPDNNVTNERYFSFSYVKASET